MKGATDLYGADSLEFLLVNIGGHDRRTIAEGDERIATYGMEGYARIRMDDTEFSNQLAGCFGQLNYGNVLIDDEGILRAIDVRDSELMTILPDSTSTAPPELKGFKLKATVGKIQGRREWRLNRSKKLTSELKTEVTVTLSLPKSWYVYGNAKNTQTPTRLTTAYTGKACVGAVTFHGKTPHGGPDEWIDQVSLTIPVTIPKGAPIGQYLLHGELSFVTCSEAGCLPPVSLPWHVTIRAI